MILGTPQRVLLVEVPSLFPDSKSFGFQLTLIPREIPRGAQSGDTAMAWYAYCLTEQQLNNGTRMRRPFILEGLQGVAGAPVLSYPNGEFAVIVSEYARAEELDKKAFLDHARVVSACFRTMTVLPFRFGTIFDCDDALRQAVRSNRKVFFQSVQRLRG